MGQLGGGGYPARSSWGGYPGWGVPWPAGGVPCWGVPWPGGYPGQGVPWPGGTLAGGYPGRYPPARSGWGGGTQLGQHREYLLHGGRYASYVHAGGLSCWKLILVGLLTEHFMSSNRWQNPTPDFPGKVLCRVSKYDSPKRDCGYRVWQYLADLCVVSMSFLSTIFLCLKMTILFQDNGSLRKPVSRTSQVITCYSII